MHLNSAFGVGGGGGRQAKWRDHVRMGVRNALCVTAAAACVAALMACGDGGHSGSPSAPSGAAASGAALPASPEALSRQLASVETRLRRAIRAWRAAGQPQGPPPDAVAVGALYVQRVVRLLARRPDLEAATLRRLPPWSARETRELTAARRDLSRLSAGWPAHHVATGPPEPLGLLLRYYRAAQSRFGIRWQILAAINLVESAFGRVQNPSVAGAQGPMQFMPATWRAYGLGGDIDNPHDAILAAANLLRHGGAPGDYSRALYAYNPSPKYVDAVQRYARLMARDRNAVYLLYSWRP